MTQLNHATTDGETTACGIPRKTYDEERLVRDGAVTCLECLEAVRPVRRAKASDNRGKPQVMSPRRWLALTSAMTRATDEWEAEVSYEEDYGDGPRTDRSRELRADIAALGEARAILVARYGKS